MIEDFEIEGGHVFYLPTGEDVTNLCNPSFDFFGAAYGLNRLAGDDWARVPPGGWKGSIYDLAQFIGVEPEVIADNFGYSLEAMDALDLDIRKIN